MINKIKNKVTHYWSDHKIEMAIVVVLVAIIIVK
tara:strand:- start:102 stop:203 length:102 start_codon:yes stop_codon:yes gene_type:complete